MKMNPFIPLFCVFVLLGCSNVTHWTSGSLSYEDAPPYTTEIQITDTSFAEYYYSWSGCLLSNNAYCDIYKSNFNGDTLFVYNLKYLESETDSNLYVLRPIIYMAFLNKGKKLYPIYNDYPRLHSYSSLAENNLEDIDSSTVESFSVNWNGWNGNEAYINYGGDFHKKGKYEALRTKIIQNRNGIDSIRWTIDYPKIRLNDSTYTRNTKVDYNGPLKNNGQ